MFSQKFKQALLGTLAAGALFASVVPVSATTVTDQTLVGGGGVKIWSDNSAETLSGPDTIVDIGDVLAGVLQIGTVENLSPPVPPGTRDFGTAGVNELSALYSFTVIGKSCTGLICTFDFGPTPAFAASLAALGFGGPTAGAVAAFFEDTTPDFTRNGTVATGIATASDGTPYLLLGQTGPGAFFQATSTAGDNIGLFPTSPSIGGFFNAGLNVLQNYTSMVFKVPACSADPVAQVCLSGTVGGPGAGGFQLWDDVNLTINVASALPEPASLSLFGVGLLGLGMIRRRKNKAKA